ncbi:MAG: hypothetical protein MHMPM18_004302, partial [Marteilia pararefringens]
LPEYMRLEYYGPTLDGQIYWVLIDYRGNLRLYSQLKHLTNNYTGDKGQDMRFIGASLFALQRLLEALQDDFNNRTLLIKQREKNSHSSPNNRVCTICQNSETMCSNSNQMQTDSNGNNSDSMSCCDLCGFAQHKACFALLNIEDSMNSSPSDTSFESPSGDEDAIASNKTPLDCDSDNANGEKCATDEDEQSKNFNRKCLACLHQSTIEELEILHDFFKRRHQEVIQEDSRFLQKLKRQLKTARQLDKKYLQSKAKYESELANWEKSREESDNSVSKFFTDQLTAHLQIINSNDSNLKKYMEDINLDSIEDPGEKDTNKQISDRESFCADLRYKSFNYHAVVAHLTDLARCQKTGQRWKLYFSRKFASVYHHQQGNNAFSNDSTDDHNQYCGDIEYEKDQLAAALDFDCTDSSPFVLSPSSSAKIQGHFGDLSNNNDDLPTKTRVKNFHNDYQKFVGGMDDNCYCTASNSSSTLDNNNNNNNNSVPMEYDEECSNDDHDGNSCEKNDQKVSTINGIIDETGETSLMRRKRGRPKGSKTRAKMQIDETTISKSISANSESYFEDTNKSKAYTRGPYKMNDRLKRKNGHHSGKTSGFGRGNQAQSEYNNQPQQIQPLNPNARKQVTSFSYNYIDAYQNQMKRMDAENLKHKYRNLNNGIITNGAAIDGPRNAEWQSRNKSFLSHEEQLEQNGTIAFGEKKRGYRRGTKLHSSHSNNNPFNMMFPQSNNMNSANYSLGEPNFLESSNIYFSPLNQTNLIYNSDLPDFDSEITKIPDELNEILQTISSTSVDVNKPEVKSKPHVFIDNSSKNCDNSSPKASQEVFTRGRMRNTSYKNTFDKNYKLIKDKNEVVQNAKMKMQTIGKRVVESSSEGEEEEELDNFGHNTKQTMNNDENENDSEFSWSQKSKKLKLDTNIRPTEANNYSEYSTNNEEEAQKTWDIINLPEFEASDVNKGESHKDDEDNEDELLSASSIHSEDIQDVLDSFFETGAANSVMAEAASNSKSPEAVSMDDVEELLSDNNESQQAVVASECYEDDDE